MDTKTKILNAAKEEFSSKGFDGASMRAIACRANINKGLLHYYFKSKEALMLEVFQTTFVPFFTSIRDLLASDQDVFLKIRGLVEHYVNFGVSNPTMPKFMVFEMSRNPEAHKVRMEKFNLKPPFELLEQSFEQAIKNNQIKEGVRFREVVLSIISLAMFPIVSKELVQVMHGMNEGEFNALMEKRKKDISEMIIQHISKAK